MSIWTTYMQYVFFPFKLNLHFTWLCATREGPCCVFVVLNSFMAFSFLTICLPNQKQKYHKHTHTFKINLHNSWSTGNTICDIPRLHWYVQLGCPTESCWYSTTTLNSYYHSNKIHKYWQSVWLLFGYIKNKSYEFLWFGFGPSQFANLFANAPSCTYECKSNSLGPHHRLQVPLHNVSLTSHCMLTEKS